jgi:hypothetical protein
MRIITIKTIEHKKQAYPTCGNFWLSPKTIQIRVSKMDNNDYELMVALHEFVEQHLCSKNNITVQAIDKFDKEFERKRKKGNIDEPGNDPKCPYYKYHQFATKLEKLMCKELGIKWNVYDKFVNSL